MVQASQFWSQAPFDSPSRQIAAGTQHGHQCWAFLPCSPSRVQILSGPMLALACCGAARHAEWGLPCNICRHISVDKGCAHSWLTRPVASQVTPLQPWQGLLEKSQPLKPQDLRSAQFAMPCWKNLSAVAAQTHNHVSGTLHPQDTT